MLSEIQVQKAIGKSVHQDRKKRKVRIWDMDYRKMFMRLSQDVWKIILFWRACWGKRNASFPVMRERGCCTELG